MAKFSKEQLRNPKILTREDLILNIQDRNQRFDALSPVEKRIAIAKDVLSQLQAKKMRATSGSYFSTSSSFNNVSMLDLPNQTVLDDIPNCSVCAIGSAFVASAQLFNKVEGQYAGDFDGDFMKNYLATFFSPKQLRLLEVAFERNTRYFGEMTCNFEERDRAIEFGNKYKDTEERLVAIWENVVANNGTFKP